MQDRRRAWGLALLALAGVVFTGVVLWATTPPGVPPAPSSLDLDASADLGPAADLAPVVTDSEPAGADRSVGPGSDPATRLAGPVTAPYAVGEPPCTPAPLSRRAAQTLLVGIPGVTDPSHPLVAELLELGVGGIFLNSGNVESRAQVMRLTRGIRGLAQRPIVIAVDEEPGRVSTFRELIGGSPSARRMADERPADAVRAHAAEVAGELTRLGVDLNLAPVADLTDGRYDEIIGDRSFSADAAIASEYALAYAQGMTDGGVRPVAKHFPGQGRSAADLHVRASEPVTAPLAVLRVTDVRPFRDLVREGVAAVMMNHLRYAALDPVLPASLAPAAYDLLRSLGFEGVAITDSLGMGAVHVTWGFYDSAPMALGAGADGLLATDGRFAVEMRDGIVDAIASGALPERRLDRAAARMAALAGADPHDLTCLDVELPVMPAGSELALTPSRIRPAIASAAGTPGGRISAR